MFGEYRWHVLPAIPPEMIFLPGRAPFSVYDMSSWSRTIFVPLSILWAKKPVARCRRRAASRSCFGGAPRSDPRAAPRTAWGAFFSAHRPRAQASPSGCRAPAACARAAVERAARLDHRAARGSDGLSAILPAMANSALALSLPRLQRGHPLLREALARSRRAAAERRGRRAAHAAVPVAGLGHRARRPRARAGGPAAERSERLARAASWLLEKQTNRRETGRGATPPRRAAGTSSTATNRIRTSTTPAWR